MHLFKYAISRYIDNHFNETELIPISPFIVDPLSNSPNRTKEHPENRQAVSPLLDFSKSMTGSFEIVNNQVMYVSHPKKKSNHAPINILKKDPSDFNFFDPNKDQLEEITEKCNPINRIQQGKQILSRIKEKDLEGFKELYMKELLRKTESQLEGLGEMEGSFSNFNRSIENSAGNACLQKDLTPEEVYEKLKLDIEARKRYSY